ncbi:MAG: hypothetical protein FWG24_01725 [Eggerthellaceae bacterium]|nr:hypothetical protein [Eggerthellaceae bacterium]
MKESATYFKWLAILCGILLLFSVGILAVGYQDITLFRAALVVAFLVGTVAFIFLARRKSR